MGRKPCEITTITPSSDALVLGAGLAGLTAACCLTNARQKVIVVEKNKQTGGLARTLNVGDYRFDLGGHRFLTNDAEVDSFVKNLLKGDYLTVSRRSKILLKGKYFDYPLRTGNSVFGLGIYTSLKILINYSIQKLRNRIRKSEQHSLQDWVTAKFGKTMFRLYFRDYSEKVWGIGCDRIAKEWIAQRIQGLSLADAVKAAVLGKRKQEHTTLTDNFIYPHEGIGAIADRLGESVEEHNEILTNASLIRLNHANGRIENAVIRQGDRNKIIVANEYISSIPVTAIVNALSPAAPQSVISAAGKLRYRDLVTVTLMLDMEKVTDQTWIYFPDKHIPFGRIHEPSNWSAKMAPPGKTSLVAEFFCFKGDALWGETDAQLVKQTVEHLEALRLIRGRDVSDSKVIRIPNAYPLFEVGFQAHCKIIYDYLDTFQNLSVTGRSGMFRYFNMDHAIRSGMSVARTLIKENSHDVRQEGKMINSTVPNGVKL